MIGVMKNLLKQYNNSDIQHMKKTRGQFYTVNSSYILDGFEKPNKDIKIIEPFAGKGDLIKWVGEDVEAYDIEPKHQHVVQRDTLLNPPDYTNKWIITNPPYLARNKSEFKEIFDKYDTNDLYKCFIYSIGNNAHGGILIIPIGFFLSSRDVDVKCRNAFLSNYQITKVKYFEEDVFPDTTTTVVAFSFIKSPTPLDYQEVEWTLFPENISKTFVLSKKHSWIIGGDIYNLPITTEIKVRRYVVEMKMQPGEYISSLTLNALDSGREDGRICLEYKAGYIYQAKETSRSYATLCFSQELNASQQQKISEEFNSIVESKRAETWSLFLPQFRESKEYARKRIPFELAYNIILHIISTTRI